MALPQDGQNANGLTKVTQIPAGKELMFIDPTTNEGGIITLEDLTKQILNGLLSQTFALDAGQKTIIQALNTLNSDFLCHFAPIGMKPVLYCQRFLLPYYFIELKNISNYSKKQTFSSLLLFFHSRTKKLIVRYMFHYQGCVV